MFQNLDDPLERDPRKEKWISKFRKAKDFKELDDLARELSNEILVVFSGGKKNYTLEGGVRRPFTNKNRNSRVNLNDKNAIQGLFGHQSHRALMEILFGESSYCAINKEEVEKHFKSILTRKTGSNINQIEDKYWKTGPRQPQNDKLLAPFTPKEISNKLRSKLDNTIHRSKSVGLDQLKFSDIFHFDKSCEILAEFFNACLRLKTVPEAWNSVYSILVQKNEVKSEKDPKKLLDIENWRIITMYDTIPKLFYACLAARLHVWSINNGILSPTQRSYLLDDAACENSFILQQCKSDAIRRRKDLCIAWLNFAEAVEHLPQSAVLYALQKLHVPAPIVNIIRTTFEQSKTEIRVTGGFTAPIPVLSCMQQGNPLNPILVHLVMEPILRQLREKSDKFEVFSMSVNHYVMPNELTLIADTDYKLQRSLLTVSKMSKLLGIKFDIDKSLAIHFFDGKLKENTQFGFERQRLKIPNDQKVSEFFDVRQGLSIGQQGKPSLEEMIQNVGKIDESLLNGYQKIESVDVYLYPRLENCLKGSYTEKEELAEADGLLESKARSWLDVPETLSSAWTKLPLAEGGAGLVPLEDLLDVMQITQAFNMLTSRCEIVRTLAFKSLDFEVKDKTGLRSKENVSKDQLALFLSGRLKIKKDYSSMWQAVRVSTLNLCQKFPLHWRYQNNEMQLVIERSKGGDFVIRGQITSNVAAKLKDFLTDYYKKEFEKGNPDYELDKNNPFTGKDKKLYQKNKVHMSTIKKSTLNPEKKPKRRSYRKKKKPLAASAQTNMAVPMLPGIPRQHLLPQTYDPVMFDQICARVNQLRF